MKAKDWQRRRGELLRGSSKKSQTVWRQTKGRDVEKLFFFFFTLFFSDARVFGKDRALLCLY